MTFGIPKAHFSLSFGTSVALSRDWSAGWNRVLAIVTPQPFQCGPAAGSVNGGVVRQSVWAHARGVAALTITTSDASKIPCFMPVTLKPQRHRGTEKVK